MVTAKKQKKVKKCGIYTWTCLKNNKKYIGSSMDFDRRGMVELVALREGRFTNNFMQKDWNDFGEEYFIIDFIKSVPEDMLLLEEHKMIDEYPNHYNISKLVKIEISDEYKEKFWERVDIKSYDECWHWKLRPDAQGYGTFTMRKDGENIHLKSHRASYFITNPNDNQYSIVCHKCDNRICCNPNHLFIGSTSDNMKDMRDKNRTHNQVLNWDDVRMIRKFHLENPKVGYKELLPIFKNLTGKEIDRRHMSEICRNLTWEDEEYKPEIRKAKVVCELYKKFKDAPMTYMNDMIKYIDETFGLAANRHHIDVIFTGKGFSRRVREDFDVSLWS